MHSHPPEARIARVEGALDQISERLGGIDRRIESVDRRLDGFEHLTALRFDQIDRRFNRLTAVVVGTWITTILAVLFHR
jgi:hypothetical protein